MRLFLHEAPGPLIVAILTVDDPDHDFKGNRKNFIDLIQTGKAFGAVVYVTTHKNLRLNGRKSLGYVYQAEKGSWITQWMPQPHVVYNRIPYRKDEELPEVQLKLKEVLRHPRVRLFNPAFFNKWQLIEWLKKSRRTKRYIPATRKMRNTLDLSRLLKKHRILYLKPEGGNAGGGIMKVKRIVSKGFPYRLSVQGERSSDTFKFASLSKLWAKINEISQGEKYIAQQAIELPAIQKRPYDLRVLVQKGIRGRWRLTGIGARVAGVSSITTHVPRGGYIDDPAKLIVSTYGKQKAKLISSCLQKAALTIARQVEKGAGYPLGEMSMDLGLDTNGGIWFFEANAKPMKFDEPHIRKKSLERFFEYCFYLTKRKLPQKKAGRGEE